MGYKTSVENLTEVLLGINLAPVTSPPAMTIDRWKVYEAGRVPNVTYEYHTINFQINGGPTEKITVRFFITPEQSILKVKYYYLRNTDEELAYYIVMELILRLSRKYPLDENYIVKKPKYL